MTPLTPPASRTQLNTGYLIAPRSLRRGWVIQPRGPHLCPRFARHGGSTRLRDISGHHIGPLPDAPQNRSENDKAERKSKPNTGDKQSPERQNTSVLNQRERGEERKPHGSPRPRVQRQKPVRTGEDNNHVQEATKHVPPKRRGNIQRKSYQQTNNRRTGSTQGTGQPEKRTATTGRSENELCQRVSHALTGANQERPNTSSQIPNLP